MDTNTRGKLAKKEIYYHDPMQKVWGEGHYKTQQYANKNLTRQCTLHENNRQPKVCHYYSNGLLQHYDIQ